MNARSLPRRSYAHPFDAPHKEQDTSSHGVDASPDAIGGFYGMGWYSTYRCRNTGEIYSVHCTDGVNGGNGPHDPKYTEWMNAMRDVIIKRTKSLAGKVVKIVISSGEWGLMRNFVFNYWLDLLPGEEFKTVGDDNKYVEQGQIGTIDGTPVVVDPKATNPLPPVGSYQARDIPTPKEHTQPTTRFGGVFAEKLRAAGVVA